MEIGENYAPCEDVAPRPPALCQGCGHRDVYAALNQVLLDYPNARVFGDIGCYTLGFLPPYKAIHSCVDMGAFHHDGKRSLRMPDSTLPSPSSVTPPLHILV